ncbi:MAG: hypothetical protein GXZ07_01705 [Firmicutes bacterium]|nr:hypothetical protein [Bacillota bacterium]
MKRISLPGIIVVIIMFILFSPPLAGRGDAAGNRDFLGVLAFRPELRIFINDLEMETETPPPLLKGHVYLPGRFFLEALGAMVNWEPATRTVTAVWGEKSLKFSVGETEALLKGAHVQPEAPAVLIAGRVYLPLRELIESLGGDVYWDGKENRVNITLEEAAVIPFLAGDLPPEYFPGKGDPYSGIDFTVETQGIRLGETDLRVRQVLGEPAGFEETVYGYQWWVYNRDPLNYMLVGIKDARAVALYIYGEQWSFGPVKAGDGLQELKKHFKPADGLYLEENRTFYKYVRPALVFPGLVASFYYDSGKKNALVALRLEERETAEERLKNFFRFRSAKGDREAWDAGRMLRAEAADERILFDLVNGARAREGLPSLLWHDGAANAARGHSKEMYLHNYFNHVSEVTGKTLAQRLDAEKVDFVLAAENIARGQMDAVEAHHDLMNSPEHRKNILNPELSSLGAGVYGDCFTQNYVTLRQ